MMLTVTQAAKTLGLSPQRVRQLIADGTLPAQAVTTRLYLIDPKHLKKVTVHGKAGRPKKA